MKYFVCETCGKVIEVVNVNAYPTMCCSKEMKELVAGISDGAVEKHVPAVRVEGNKVIVTIGDVEHPMSKEHHIDWIEIETKQGSQKKCLCVDKAPKAEFILTEGDELVTVYAYCNLHGLWKKDCSDCKKAEQIGERDE